MPNLSAAGEASWLVLAGTRWSGWCGGAPGASAAAGGADWRGRGVRCGRRVAAAGCPWRRRAGVDGRGHGAQGRSAAAPFGGRRSVDQLAGDDTRSFIVGLLGSWDAWRCGYRSAQSGGAGRAGRPVLADWLVGARAAVRAWRGASANVVTVDSGGRVAVEPVRGARGAGAPAAVPVVGRRLSIRGKQDATFLVAGRRAIGPGDPARDDAPAARRCGRPSAGRRAVYRFDGFTVDCLECEPAHQNCANSQAEAGSVASLTCWKAPLMRHAETNWNKFVGIACAPRPLPASGGLAWLRVAVTITHEAARTLDDTSFRSASQDAGADQGADAPHGPLVEPRARRRDPADHLGGLRDRPRVHRALVLRAPVPLPDAVLLAVRQRRMRARVGGPRPLDPGHPADHPLRVRLAAVRARLPADLLLLPGRLLPGVLALARARAPCASRTRSTPARPSCR